VEQSSKQENLFFLLSLDFFPFPLCLGVSLDEVSVFSLKFTPPKLYYSIQLQGKANSDLGGNSPCGQSDALASQKFD
jgi:hypothetical protein